MVREVWMDWAREQPEPKPSWLVPWERLSEPDREVDRRIGERVYVEGYRAGALAVARGEIVGLSPEPHHTDIWTCPNCSWEQLAHPTYGWGAHDDRAVEVHRMSLCPGRVVPMHADGAGGWWICRRPRPCLACVENDEPAVLRPVTSPGSTEGGGQA